jgi:uncharacterized protein
MGVAGTKAIVTMAGASFAALAVFVAGIALFQDRLLYFPMQATVAALEAAPLAAWPEREQFRGLIAQPPQPKATAIVFHGNAGHAGHRAFYARELAPLGLRVILAEYPGYGPRDGPLGEASLVADAEQSVAAAHDRYGSPLVVIGESLGAAVAAAAAASQPERVTGLLLITPWDRLEHVASHHYPWLPVRWLLRDRYDTRARLAGFARPVSVVVAERDSIVPAQLGVSLHDALDAPKEQVVVRGAGHNDWAGRVGGDWWRARIEFLLGRPLQ